MDTLLALLIQSGPLAAGFLAGLFVLILVTRAYGSDGTLRVSTMIRALLILALAATIALPKMILGTSVATVALMVAFLLFGLSAPSQGLNVRLLGPYLIFAVLFIMATGLHMVGDGGFTEPSALRALGIGVLGSFLMANYFNSAADLKPLFIIMLPVLVFGAGLSITQAITGQNYFVGDLYNRSGQDRLVAFGYGSNNVLHAMSMMAGLVITGYFYFTAQRWKWLFLAVAALMVFGLMLSSAQSAWGGAVVMVTVMALLIGGKARVGSLLILVAVVGISVVFLFRFESSGAFSPLTSLVRERESPNLASAGPRLDTRLLGQYHGSLEQRIEYWREARRLFGTSPVWGLGFTEFQAQSAHKAEAHNLYLSIASETGLLGLSGFVLMFWLVFTRAARVSKNLDPDSRLALQFLVGLMAGYLFIGVFWHLEVNRFFWLSFGLLGGMTGLGLVSNRSAEVPSRVKVTGPISGERA